MSEVKSHPDDIILYDDPTSSGWMFRDEWERDPSNEGTFNVTGVVRADSDEWEKFLSDY